MEIKNWTMEYPGTEDLVCIAPCTMYSVLLENGKIPDPFYGMNDKKLTALADADCSFEAVFDTEEGMLSKDFAELTFYGLDTLCTITLNGRILDSVRNMHRAYTYEVKALLKERGNILRLDFQSPTRYFAQRHQRHYVYMNDGDTIPGASHLRKAFYMSGWDWGPALPDEGIYRPVNLRCYDRDRIREVEVRQDHHDGVVDVTILAATEKNSGAALWASFDGQRVLLQNGKAVIRVEKPRLWWVRGYGEQPLYDLTVELLDGDRVLDRDEKKIGLRTLTVSTQKDLDGTGSEFCFVINGVKIFSMGANYVPQDNLLTRVTHEKIDQLIGWARDANFNSLRVWGGGIYPDDYFFELCDREGILVWQDFMIACANVWLTPEFKQECILEAEQNLRRLRHHACLGLICGNNEMETAVLNWGITNSLLVKEDYLELYERILPEIAERLAPDIFYWPSSPCSGGGFDDPGDFSRGDTHYWEVWHGGVPFTTYRKMHFRFCSEYGFEAFPSMKTIDTFCPEEEKNCFSRIMEDHQKCRGGNSKILRYLADNYLYPHSFDKLVYASQLLQADAISYGVEHFRRERGYCMGSLYWQFNDCWPVASWSSVDSQGRYKALHYAAKKFYAPVAMGLFLEHGTLTVNIANETMEAFRGRVELKLCRGDLTVLDQLSREIAVKQLSSQDVLTYEVPGADPNDTYLAADLFDEAGTFLMRKVELMVPAKHFSWRKPSFTVECRQAGNQVAIDISTDVFAKGVDLEFTDFDCVLSDNFFALTDREPLRILARTDRSPEEVKKNLVIQSVYDIR